jgi:hypothetical protein
VTERDFTGYPLDKLQAAVDHVYQNEPKPTVTWCDDYCLEVQFSHIEANYPSRFFDPQEVADAEQGELREHLWCAGLALPMGSGPRTEYPGVVTLRANRNAAALAIAVGALERAVALGREIDRAEDAKGPAMT